MARAIELSGVELRFDGGAKVLDGVDLVIEEGSVLGLIGPPSCGKSALLKLLAGLVRPTGGGARALGVELSTVSASERRALQRNVGMLFQNNALFDSRTVLENVAFPLRRLPSPPSEDEIQARCRARLAEVGLSHALDRFPHQLSGGMQKRCGIARATIASPRLRLFDEPTAGLDPVTSARILALILELGAQDPSAVTIIVSNEMDTLLKSVRRVLMLDAGKVVWDGPHEGAPEVFRSFVTGDAA